MARGGRRRFGVSIPEPLARSLDELAKKFGRDRSSLVAEALRTYIHDHEHFLLEHVCSGVIIAWSESGTSKGIREAVEEFMGVVKAHLHAHINSYCVDVLVVEGRSSRILELVKKIMNEGCIVRYIPLGGLGENREYTGRGNTPPCRGP